MPKWDSTEAPLTVTVDTPNDYSGHMDDKPLKVSVDTGVDAVDVSGDASPIAGVQVALSPGEAYHLVDDLQAAADSCWGAAEYVVTAHFNPGQRYVGTMKAPTPADAVRRTVDLLETRNDEDELSGEDFRRLTAAREAERFSVYRADSVSAVSPDDLNDDNENHD